MSDNSNDGNQSCFVKAICSYHYPYKDEEIHIKKDEIFLLIRKTTEDWWQVIRSGDKRTFYAPSKYLEFTIGHFETRKSSLKKKLAHQRHLQAQQRLHLEALSKNRELSPSFSQQPLTESSEESRCKPFLPNDIGVVKAVNTHSSKRGASNNNEISSIDNASYQSSERNRFIYGESDCDLNNSSSAAMTSLSNSVRVTSQHSILVDDSSRRYRNADFDTNNEFSVIDPPVAFLDNNRNPNNNISLISDEESGEGNNSPCDFNISDDSLLPNNKSNDSYSDSVDPCSSNATRIDSFESFSTDTSRSSLDRGSVDSFRISKNGRGSVSKAASFDVLIRRGGSVESLDDSHCSKAASSEEIDRTNGRGTQGHIGPLFTLHPLSHRDRSSSVELKRVDNRFDLSDPGIKTTSLDKGRKLRLTRDPMNRRRSWALNEHFYTSWNNNVSSVLRGNSHEQDRPPKLPPKMRKGGILSVISASSDELHRLGVNTTSSSSETPPISSLPLPPKSKALSTFPSSASHPSNSNEKGKCGAVLHDKTHDNRSMENSNRVARKVHGQQVLDNSSRLTRKIHDQQISENSDSMTISLHDNRPMLDADCFTNSSVNSSLKGKSSVAREASVGELIEKMENKSKLWESTSTALNKSIFELPMSPTEPPRRLLFDDWGEFLDPNSGRPFYYNQTTKEKRWKPPRRSVPHAQVSRPSDDSSDSTAGMISTFGPSTNTSLSSSHSYSTFDSSSKTGVTSSISRLSSSSSTSSSPVTSTPKLLVKDKSTFSLPCDDNSSISHHTQPLSSTASPHTQPLCLKETSPPPKSSSKSFFSSISSSFSFMKPSSSQSHNFPPLQTSTPIGLPHHTSSNRLNPLQLSKSAHNIPIPHSFPSHSSYTPLAPPSSAKPLPVNSDQSKSYHQALLRFHVPHGWIRKYDALSHQVYFHSLVTGEKWNPAIDKSGTVYVYSSTGVESRWNLPQYENLSPVSPQSPPIFPAEQEIGEPFLKSTVVWRYLTRDGKKSKKSWATAIAKYFPPIISTTPSVTPTTSSIPLVTPPGVSSSPMRDFGVITFAKKHNESKVDRFDLIPPCSLDLLPSSKKNNTLSLGNSCGGQIQVQVENSSVAAQWTKALIENDKIVMKTVHNEKGKKTGNSKSDKENNEEQDSTKGIKDTLMMFFKRRIQQETLAKKGIYKDTVFGSTIGEICLKEQLKTPVFVLQVIRCIEKDRSNFKIDGLYRISGNASRIQKIRIEVGQNRYGILDEEKDVHNLTGALKLFLRELKEPVIPFENYDSFIQATDYHKHKCRSDALRQAVKKLPSCNRETLRILLDHLLKVNEFEKDNRMSIMNLAIVFGPCLLWPETTSGFDLMTDAMLHNRVVEALLSDYEAVFKKK